MASTIHNEGTSIASINKLLNEYVGAIPRDLYDDIPKAVWAAIAISALTCGGDRLDGAADAVVREWDALNGNGIVPQKVPTRFCRLLIEEAP